MIDLYPQPFKVGDTVKVNPKFENILIGKEKYFIGRTLVVKEIKWIGMGDEDDPYGCESGWEVSVNDLTTQREMDGYDSHWFVKKEK